MTDGKVTFIRLADGTIIDPITKKPIAQPDPPEAILEEPTVPLPTIQSESRRSLHDLTLSAPQMAIINNVLVYTLWGLPDDEIALVCNCTPDDVNIVRSLKEYTDMRDALIEGLRKAYMSQADGIIAQASTLAASIVVGALKDKRKSFEAAKDVLDRSGHRPTDRNSLNLHVNNEDQLVIRVMRETHEPRTPVIDLKIDRA